MALSPETDLHSAVHIDVGGSLLHNFSPHSESCNGELGDERFGNDSHPNSGQAHGTSGKLGVHSATAHSPDANQLSDVQSVKNFSPPRYAAGQQCPLCGNGVKQAGGKHWVGQDGIQLWQCCENLLAWAWPSVEAYENHYQADIYHRDACLAMGLPSQYERFEEHRQADKSRIAYLSGHFDWLGLKVLDVGASNGAFVYAASTDLPCAFALGLEPNPAIAHWAMQSHGVAMEVGDWSKMQGQWDLVVATDIIEHLTDPTGFLCRVRAHAPFLYLETPDWFPMRPHDWKHIKPYEHICLYSERSLLELAMRCGWIARDVYRPIEGKLAVLLETWRK